MMESLINSEILPLRSLDDDGAASGALTLMREGKISCLPSCHLRKHAAAQEAMHPQVCACPYAHAHPMWRLDLQLQWHANLSPCTRMPMPISRGAWIIRNMSSPSDSLCFALLWRVFWLPGRHQLTLASVFLTGSGVWRGGVREVRWGGVGEVG